MKIVGVLKISKIYSAKFNFTKCEGIFGKKNLNLMISLNLINNVKIR
jgi:hypothetical protein